MKKVKFLLKSFLDVFLLVYYTIYFKLCNKKRLDVWLVSERGFDAKDNGYFFYKYLKQHHPEINVKYVISKKSNDAKKIDPEDIVDYRSKEHYLYFLYSKYLISAQVMGMSPNEQLYYRLNKYGLLKIGKTVFLQHGITKDFNQYLLPENTKVDLFVCGAVPEHKYMIEKYKYSKDVARLTGFARFDNLIDGNKKYILIMPTWRKWLKYNETLIGTDFYNYYMSILTDKDIQKKLEKANFKIVFYPHVVLQKFINEFKNVNSKNVVIADFDNYDVQQLLIDSRLLITDYSSVAFDFAYMKKKTIYCQFDLEKYRSEQYGIGYYDYNKHGFGPVVQDRDKLKKYILDYLEDSKSLDKYNSRIDSFFKNIDFNNCERIYNDICKLYEGDKNEKK